MARARASKRVFACLGLLVLPVVSGCASEFDRRYQEADGLRQEAASRGYEWIGTADLLEQAREQEEQGNTAAALELVAQARFQADAALRQAARESEAWKDRVLR